MTWKVIFDPVGKIKVERLWTISKWSWNFHGSRLCFCKATAKLASCNLPSTTVYFTAEPNDFFATKANCWQYFKMVVTILDRFSKFSDFFGRKVCPDFPTSSAQKILKILKTNLEWSQLFYNGVNSWLLLQKKIFYVDILISFLFFGTEN